MHNPGNVLFMVLFTYDLLCALIFLSSSADEAKTE